MSCRGSDSFFHSPFRQNRLPFQPFLPLVQLPDRGPEVTYLRCLHLVVAEFSSKGNWEK